MGNWNQGSSGLSDEDMDQSLQQDIAAANFAASGGDLGGYTFGGNFVNDADNPGYTGTSTNMNQAVADMQGLFNTQRGITASNPYGKEGFFSRVLGIDPSKIDYSGNMNLNTRMSIANNQFSKYMNPQNVRGQIGYNDAYDTAEKGKLRAGVQDAGYQTVYGPVMEQARQQTTGEMLARGAMGLFGGPIGMLVGQLGTQEYGLPGVDGFDSFDPNNPRAGGGILGAMLGGLNPSQAADKAVQAVDSLRARFSPTLAPTTNAGIGSLTPASYETRADIRNRLSSTNPLSGETSVTSAPSSIVDGLNGFQTETLPDGSVRSVQTTGGMTKAEADEIKNNFENTKNLSAEEAAARAMERLENSSYNFFTDPQAGGTYPSATTGEQLAGSLFDSLFRDPNISPEAREILKEKGMTIDDLFAPKTPTPEPEKPNIMDLIQGAIQTSALGGPATANQLAQVDYSNLSNVGGNLYQARPKTSRLDSILESLGMKTSPSGPSGQIYSGAKKPQSLFDYIGFGQ
jgi:hypothetical protein